MRDLCRLIGWMVVDLIRSRVMLEAEIWTLRQQIDNHPTNEPAKIPHCARSSSDSRSTAKQDRFATGTPLLVLFCAVSISENSSNCTFRETASVRWLVVRRP